MSSVRRVGAVGVGVCGRCPAAAVPSRRALSSVAASTASGSRSWARGMPEPRPAWGPAVRRSHTRQFQQKEPAVRPRRTVGFGKRFGASEAPASGAVRAVAVLSHRDRLRTASAPREGPRPRQQAPRSKPQVHQIEPGKRLLTDSFAHCWPSPALKLTIQCAAAVLSHNLIEPKSSLYPARCETRALNPPLQPSAVPARSPCVVKMTQT